MLILLTIKEDLVDIIVVVVIYVANVRGLDYSDWLLLLLRLMVFSSQVCFGLNDGRCVVLLEWWSILLKGLILAQDAVTHCQRANCYVANGTSCGCGRTSHT